MSQDFLAPPGAKKDSPSSFSKGLSGEARALHFFLCRGFVCQAHRFKTPRGEVDLIVSRGDTLVFVEVKYRQNLHQAVGALGENQKRRLYEAAEIFLQQQPADTAYTTLRFDLLALGRCGAWRHFRNIL